MFSILHKNISDYAITTMGGIISITLHYHYISSLSSQNDSLIRVYWLVVFLSLHKYKLLFMFLLSVISVMSKGSKK